jgi:hypothetical protein
MKAEGSFEHFSDYKEGRRKRRAALISYFDFLAGEKEEE